MKIPNKYDSRLPVIFDIIARNGLCPNKYSRDYFLHSDKLPDVINNNIGKDRESCIEIGAHIGVNSYYLSSIFSGNYYFYEPREVYRSITCSILDYFELKYTVIADLTSLKDASALFVNSEYLVCDLSHPSFDIYKTGFKHIGLIEPQVRANSGVRSLDGSPINWTNYNKIRKSFTDHHHMGACVTACGLTNQILDLSLS